MPLTKQQRLRKQYRAANSEYHRVTNYLNAAQAILTKPERDLLMAFADLAKRRTDRLRMLLRGGLSLATPHA